MEKCDCYYERSERWNLSNGTTTIINQGHCNGTKEQDPCSCGGDRAKCDFYEHVRREAQHKMNTAEMYIEANKIGNKNNVYFAPGTNYTYNQDTGFVFEPDERGADAFMALEWQIDDRIPMTKDEAEKKYNIKIVD